MTDNITELAAEKAKRQGQLPEHADDRMAYAFTTANAGILRYVARQGAWYVWDGTRWAEDTTLDVFDRVRAFCREVASRADPRIRVRLASRAKAGAVHGFAHGRPAHRRDDRALGRGSVAAEHAGRRGRSAHRRDKAGTGRKTS